MAQDTTAEVSVRGFAVTVGCPMASKDTGWSARDCLAMTFLLISGLPGSGKTTFCRWLSSEQGYHHLDIDNEASRNTPVPRSLVDPRPGALQDLIQSLTNQHGNVVLDWGFPPRLIDRVRLLRHFGAELWWFGGDEEAAIRSFQARGTVDMQTLAVQLSGIRAYWPQIEKVFQGRMLEAILPGPTYAPSEELFRTMGGPGG